MPEILKYMKTIILINDYLTLEDKIYVNDLLINNNFYEYYNIEGGFYPCYKEFYQIWKKHNFIIDNGDKDHYNFNEFIKINNNINIHINKENTNIRDRIVSIIKEDNNTNINEIIDISSFNNMIYLNEDDVKLLFVNSENNLTIKNLEKSLYNLDKNVLIYIKNGNKKQILFFIEIIIKTLKDKNVVLIIDKSNYNLYINNILKPYINDKIEIKNKKILLIDNHINRKLNNEFLLKIHSLLDIKNGDIKTNIDEQLVFTNYLLGNEKILEIQDNFNTNNIIISCILNSQNNNDYVKIVNNDEKYNKISENKDNNGLCFYIEKIDSLIESSYINKIKEKYDDINFNTLIIDLDKLIILKDCKDILNNVNLIFIKINNEDEYNLKIKEFYIKSDYKLDYYNINNDVYYEVWKKQ